MSKLSKPGPLTDAFNWGYRVGMLLGVPSGFALAIVAGVIWGKL